MREFEYRVATSVAEAVALAGQSHGPYRFLAGGTDLFLALEHGARRIERVIDLKGIPEMDRIAALPDGGYELGALVRMTDIMAHPGLRASFPALVAGAAVVGGPPIRNRATVGGNLCNASPAADASTPLLGYRAKAMVVGGSGERTIPLSALWTSPRQTCLVPGELVRAIRLPALPAGSGASFQRLTRSAMDIAGVNAAAVVTLDDQGRVADATLALGAVAPTVIDVPEIDAALHGRTVDQSTLRTVEEAARAAAQPIDDVRASADYRREMAGVLARRAVQEAAEVAVAAQAAAPQAARSAPSAAGQAGGTP